MQSQSESFFIPRGPDTGFKNLGRVSYSFLLQLKIDQGDSFPGQSSVGVKREDFLETSVLQRLRGLEQAAALVSPCTGLSACVFALSTAVLVSLPLILSLH